MNNNLNQKITWASVLRFTLPSILMMVVMSFYTIVDGIFVSRLINTDAFSAVNIVYPMMSLVIGIGTMLGTGTTAIASMKLGEKKEGEARQIVTFVILITLILGAVLTVISALFLDQFIWLLGANESVFDYCRQYALPLLFFLPASMLQLQFQSLFVANGRPGLGLAVTIASGITNIILDYVFIAFFGMGVAGAALATGIGYLIAAVYGLYYFTFHREAPLHFVRPAAKWRALLHAMSNGSSEMVSYLSSSVTTFLFNIIMMRLAGPDGIAAISVILYLDFVLIAVNLGYSIGAAPLFGYNYGSGEYKKLKRLFRLSTCFCFFVGIAMVVLTNILARPLAGIFASPGSTVFELSVSGLGIYSFSYLFKGYNVFGSALFTALGNGKISALLSFMRTLVLITAATLIFASLFGITGVWIATPAAEALSLILTLLMILKYRKHYHYM